MNASPFISIIIPVYNAEKWLPQCLDSLLVQTYTNFECICVNDGSTDHSLEILNNYVVRDRRIRHISQENKGEGAARNAGIAQTRGEYLLSADPDDYLPPAALQILVDAMQRYGSEVVVGGVSIVTPQKKELTKRAVTQVYINIAPMERPDLAYYSTGLHTSLLILKRIVADNAIKYKENCVTSPDAYYLFSLIGHVQTMTIIPDIVYCYRQTPEGASRVKRGFGYLHDDMLMYKVLFEQAGTDIVHTVYAAQRLMYRWRTFFTQDLRNSWQNLSSAEQRLLLERLSAFFKRYNVGTQLAQIYSQTALRSFTKAVNAYLVHPNMWLVTFSIALQNGNVDECMDMATAINASYRIGLRTALCKSTAPIARLGYLLRLPWILLLKVRSIIQ